MHRERRCASHPTMHAVNLRNMSEALFSRMEPIQTMADGTIKQVNPFSGTEVWTVPGRGSRPFSVPAVHPAPLSEDDFHYRCAFCDGRELDTPPEKARILPSGGILRGVPIEEYEQSVPSFRRVPNLFEIVSYDYWRENYGFEMDEETRQRMESYLADPAGREHVLKTIRTKRAAAKLGDAPEDKLLEQAAGFFAGGHDVIIAARHFINGATDDSQLASSGTLSPEEHALFTAFTADAIRDLYERNRYADYVVAFQNWLAAAGASFDHLHKQVVAIDDRGMASHREVELQRRYPNMYNEWAVDYAAKQNLVIAENDHAVLLAGFGHRYPTLEIFSKAKTCEPWLHTNAELTGVSDLIHAAHTAVGADVPCNEEWHHRPADVELPQPWRVMIKLRISTLAGFEGGTKIYINTISPWDLRDRVVAKLYTARDERRVAKGIRIATECLLPRNSLRYIETLTRSPA